MMMMTMMMMIMKICGVGLRCDFKNLKIHVSVLSLKTHCVGGGYGRQIVPEGLN